MSAPARAETAAATAPPPQLEVESVVKRFGGVVALDGADLAVPRGVLAALIGPNGAGKSTLFNVVTGVESPDEGRVRVAGDDVTGEGLSHVASAGVARTFQAPRGFQSMTALGNLMVVPPSRGQRLLTSLGPWGRARKAVRAQAEHVLERVGLQDHGNTPYEKLSVGQLRLLEIGRHLMRDVSLLLLDEPTSGVVPSQQEQLGRLLTELRDDGMTILVVEHNLGFVMPLVSTVAVMDRGRVIRHGPPAEIQADPAVISAYLGVAEP